MKRRHVLLGLLYAYAVSAHAKDESFPTLGLLYHTTEGSSIQYSCSLVGQELQCDMTQSFVRKQLSDAEIPKRMADVMASILKEGNDKKQCKELTDTSKQFRERLADRTKVPPENRKQFDQMTQTEKDFLLEYLNVSEEVCRTNSFTAKQAMRDLVVRDEASTCRVGTNNWKETFKRQYNAEGVVWVSSSAPQGACGVIQLNRFELDTATSGTGYWNYIARKVISNPDGPAFMGKCAELDEGTYAYSWKSRDLYLNCRKIKFSVF